MRAIVDRGVPLVPTLLGYETRLEAVGIEKLLTRTHVLQ